MLNTEYQHLSGVSSHALKAMNVSPAHCWAKYLNPQRPESQPPSSSIRIGSLVHCLMLTPDLYDREFVLYDHDNRRTKVGRERWAALEATGKTVVTQAEMETARTIQKSLLYRNRISRLLDAPLREHLIIKDRGPNRLPLKSRLDAYHPDAKCIVELKTVRSLEFINVALTKYGYLLSAAFYMTVADADDFIFIFVETSEPFTAVTLEMTHEQQLIGFLEFQEALKRFDECWQNNDWPDTCPIDDDPLMMPMKAAEVAL
jgi:hypothetical protein